MYEESDRLAWQDVFNHKIFQEVIGLETDKEIDKYITQSDKSITEMLN